MKTGSFVTMIVLSMHTVSMFSMLLNLDPAYQRMVEQQFNPNETHDVTIHNNVHEDDDLGKDVEESWPAHNLIGWEWLTG
jgi:hypothetical protein